MEEKRKQPTQRRSVEKRNLILKSGFALMMQNGYYNTTTDDIAKAAGISTGIIYRYFSNKKELLLAALDLFIGSMEETYFKASESKENSNIHSLLGDVLDRFISLHMENKTMHEEMEALRYADAEIAQSYARFDQLLITYTGNLLSSQMADVLHSKEKIWMALQLMEGYCHALIRSADNLDFPYLKEHILDECVTILV